MYLIVIMKNITFMITSLELIFTTIDKEGRRGVLYTAIIVCVFVVTHFMAANYVEEPASFYPPYIEKRVVYPELYKDKK